jgi:hypothetical protein
MTDVHPAFADLARALPVRLLTVSALDAAAGVARRVYTNAPEAYPLSGVKPLDPGDAWGRLVVGQGRTFVANSPSAYRDLFPDHALIASLGCGSVVNVPVADDNGTVVGCVNALEREGYFTPDRVLAVEGVCGALRQSLVVALAGVLRQGG